LKKPHLLGGGQCFKNIFAEKNAPSTQNAHILGPNLIKTFLLEKIGNFIAFNWSK
jgi:hypothetical protein